jgi:tetratricopeptide (TPR) repeat protein
MQYQPADFRELKPLYEHAIAEKESGDPKLAASMLDYGTFLLRNGDVTSAETWLRRSLSLDAKNQTREQLAIALEASGKIDEATALYREASKDPTLAASCLARLGNLAESQGNAKSALDYYQRAAAVSKGSQAAARLNDIGLLLEKKKSYVEAQSSFERALAMQEKELGVGHPEVAATLNNLALLSLTRGNPNAEQYERRSLSILESALGPHHLRVGVSSSNLARILRAKKDEGSARYFYKRALAIFEQQLGPKHQWTIGVKEALASR